MPLEMFNGRTGPRLIAREPIDPDSYAEIAVLASGTSESHTLKVTYQGMKANGYPALSPIVETLPDRYRRYLAEERRRLEELSSTLKRLAQQRVEQYGSRIAHLDNVEIQWQHTLVIPRVMTGEDLVVVLPGGYSRSRVNLGPVGSITLHN